MFYPQNYIYLLSWSIKMKMTPKMKITQKMKRTPKIYGPQKTAHNMKKTQPGHDGGPGVNGQQVQAKPDAV